MADNQIVYNTIRDQVFTEVQSRLEADVKINNVFFSRPNDVVLANTPCCLFYFENDNPIDEDRRPKAYKQILDLRIQFLYKWDNQGFCYRLLNAREHEAKRTLFDSTTDSTTNKSKRNLGLGDYVQKVSPGPTTPMSLDGDNGSIVESNNIQFMIHYYDNLDYIKGIGMNEFLKLHIDNTTTDGDGAESDSVINVREEDEYTL